MAHIGIIAMSAKPVHVGHDRMIRRAARECDEVHLYVSLSDRKRAGETVPVLGSDMARIWRDIIEPTLPPNVRPTYGGSPIGNVWAELGAAARAGGNDTYAVYADAEDLAQNFSDDLLQRYCGGLLHTGRVERVPTERAGSGTLMRAFLAKGDRDSFIAGLPHTIDRDAVWGILSATARNPPKVKTTTGSKRKARRAEQPA